MKNNQEMTLIQTQRFTSKVIQIFQQLLLSGEVQGDRVEGVR